MSLRALHLIGRFPELYERALLQEIAALVEAGVDCRIAAYHASGDPAPDEFRSLADRVRYLDVVRSSGRIISGLAGLGVGMGYLFCAPRMLCACASLGGGGGANIVARRARLAHLLEEESPNLVHAQFGHLGVCFLPVVEAAKVPLIVSFRGQDVGVVGRMRRPARRLWAYASRILARSEAMQADLLDLGCPAGKVLVLPSGIDVASVPFRERTRPAKESDIVILMAGRLVEKKGMADGLRALAQGRPGPSGPRVRIAGDGPEKESLAVLADRLGLSDRVAFLGALPHAEVLREMAAAHLFMLPCRTARDGDKEGIPNVLKEAQASGLPIISTRHAGIPECVVHGETGLLCDEGDVQGLAANLDRLLSCPELWPVMGRQGRARVEAMFDAASLAARLAAEYRAAAG